MSDNVIKLNMSSEFLLESAEKRYERGDYLGSLTMLNKHRDMFDPNADVAALYADNYEALGLYQLSLDSWFRFLDICNEEDFTEGFEGLAVAFMNLGNDAQAEFYYRKAYDMDEPAFDVLFEEEKPRLRLIHSDDGSIGSSEAILEGLDLIREGRLEEAKEVLSAVQADSTDFSNATGLTALCMLLSDDIEGAAEKCREFLSYCPDDVSTLTTYCAVLVAKGDMEAAREIGSRIAAAHPKSTEDLFRAAAALCETGQDEEAFQKFAELKRQVPYFEDSLWFYAVSAYKTGREQEAISALEDMTTINPRKAVAKFYLEKMRAGEEVSPSYVYRLPDGKYKELAQFLLSLDGVSIKDFTAYYDRKEVTEYIRLALDHLDGRDEKLHALALREAVRLRLDDVVREILLSYSESELSKFNLLFELTLRNEKNSFGVAICSVYREFFTHELEIDGMQCEAFSRAFANVYSKYAVVSEENEEKIIDAAEEVYITLSEEGATELLEKEEALAAVIFREARMRRAERSLKEIAEMFSADLNDVKDILDYML